MKKWLIPLAAALLCACGQGASGTGPNDVRPANYASGGPRFKALLFYSDSEEDAHVAFAHQAIKFFDKLTVGEGFVSDSTQALEDYTLKQLQEYTVIVALNAQPSQAGRPLFEQYMESGGGWLGFHAAAYNDSNTEWPWFVHKPPMF